MRIEPIVFGVWQAHMGKKAKNTPLDFGESRSPREHPPLTPTEVIAHRALSRRTQELRKAKGWSQNKLADFAGIGRGYLSHPRR